MLIGPWAPIGPQQPGRGVPVIQLDSWGIGLGPAATGMGGSAAPSAGSPGGAGIDMLEVGPVPARGERGAG
jgi:hypothetical protein